MMESQQHTWTFDISSIVYNDNNNDNQYIL